MRRKDKEITARAEIDAIIGRALVCRLALAGNNIPYVVPLCFGYDGTHLYFHSAGGGTKIDMLRENPAVAFEFDTDCEPLPAEKSCAWSMKYRSVVGSGRAVFVDNPVEKQKALDIICAHYMGNSPGIDGSAEKSVTVIRVDIREISGKKSGT